MAREPTPGPSTEEIAEQQDQEQYIMALNLPTSRGELDGLATVDLALYWASLGCRVLPVYPATKRPIGKGWQREATTDEATIRAWWKANPDAHVGIATGDPGPDVVDIDVKGDADGMASLEKLLDLGVIEERTFMLVSTPSDGRHLWFEGSAERNHAKGALGVDFRGAGGMVLAPGNPGRRLMSLPPKLAPVDWAACVAALAPATPPAPPGTNRQPAARQTAPLPPPVAPVAYAGGKLVAPLNLAPEGRQAPPEQVEARVRQLAAELASARIGEGNDTASRLSTEVGNLVGHPGNQLSFDRAVAIMESALVGWTFRKPGDEETMRNTIRRQIEFGMARPRMWRDGTRRAEQAQAASVPPPNKALLPVAETFWGERTELRDIRWLARERRVSPWSVLGCALALVSCRVGPHVVLPKIVGGYGSLNLLVGLVGPSGKGKGASWGVAQEYLDLESMEVSEVSTPEGIDASFTETPPRSMPIQYNDVAFFYVPEVDRLKTQAEQTALLSHLRKVYSGELLGGKTAAKERWRPVRAHTYRASVAVGIQPRRAGAILGDADGGLPQRFLWMPVHDPNHLRRTDKLQPPLYAGAVPAVDQDVWVPEGEQRGEKGEPEPVQIKSRWVIPVCRTAEEEVLDAREANLGTEHGDLDSHALLTQLKAAALLAFLNRRAEVTEDDWRLARIVMKVSDRTRDWCARELRAAMDEESARRGRSRAVTRVHEEMHVAKFQTEAEQEIARLADLLVGHLQDAGDWMSPRDLKLKMSTKARDESGDKVIAELMGRDEVEVGPEVTRGGKKIQMLRWANRQPNTGSDSRA